MRMRMAVMILLTIVSIIAPTLPHMGAIRLGELKQLATRHNITCVLVFGDSSVDPGNNNRLRTTFKGNFAPYGEDFINRIPTGRFTNGKLPTDFIAESLGFTSIIPGYLDPNVKKEQLLHGVSFASAASGYDDLTANLTSVLPLSKQLEYLKHYKIRLSGLVGQNRADEIIRNAIFVISMGTNDYIQNYFLQPFRPKQFTVAQYEDFLVAKMVQDIKEMNRSVGARRLVIVGLSPLGCMPLVKTLMGETRCVDSYNKAAFSFNNKVRVAMAKVKASLGMKTAYVDTYGIIERAMKNPTQYGFTETTKGCCGSGIIEFGDTCKGMDTCKDRSKYLFWDAVHPTEKMYRIIADEAIKSAVDAKIFV